MPCAAGKVGGNGLTDRAMLAVGIVGTLVAYKGFASGLRGN